MSSKEIKKTFFFTLLTITSLFLILWLVDFSNLQIPTTIPYTDLRTYGILILIAFSIIIFFYQKILVKTNPEISIPKLILLSTFIILTSLLIYQFFRQYIILGRPLSSQILISAIFPTIILIFIAASTALSAKRVKGFARQIPFLLLVIVVLIFKNYATSIEW